MFGSGFDRRRLELSYVRFKFILLFFILYLFHFILECLFNVNFMYKMTIHCSDDSMSVQV